MIKLELPEKPIQLTDEIEKELTEQFKKMGRLFGIKLISKNHY